MRPSASETQKTYSRQQARRPYSTLHCALVGLSTPTLVSRHLSSQSSSRRFIATIVEDTSSTMTPAAYPTCSAAPDSPKNHVHQLRSSRFTRPHLKNYTHIPIWKLQRSSPFKARCLQRCPPSVLQILIVLNPFKAEETPTAFSPPRSQIPE